jgi:hypothetical protein
MAPLGHPKLVIAVSHQPLPGWQAMALLLQDCLQIYQASHCLWPAIDPRKVPA